MEQDLQKPLQLLRVDGGAAANNLLMQFQSDVLKVPISRPQIIERTALGAALLAGLGVGRFQGFDGIRRIVCEDRRFEPSVVEATRAAQVARWQDGLARV